MAQRTFDFARAGKLNLLEHLNLPDHAGTTQGAMCHVLKAVDAKARNYPVFTIAWHELAAITCLHKNTVRRAARGLVAMDLLILHVRRDCGWHCYGFQICWSNLQDHRAVDNLSVDPFFAAQDRGTIGQDRGTIRQDRGTMAVLPRNRSKTAHKTPDRKDAHDDAHDDRPIDRFDREKANHVATAIHSVVASDLPLDLDLAAKLAMLVGLGKIKPEIVDNALGAVTLFKPSNRGAYLFTCVDNRLPPGEPLGAMLATLPSGAAGTHGVT